MPEHGFSTADLGAFVSRLELVCGLDSPTGDFDAVDGVAETLAGWAREDGCEAELIATAKGHHLRATVRGTGTGRVLLLGHHDTVWPLGTAARAPVKVVGNRASGPGSADMKAGLLVGLLALARLAAGDRSGFGEVELHSLPDEEARIGPPDRLDLLAGADAALGLECGRESGAIVAARSAATWILLEARGRSAHAGQDPDRGRSALQAAIAEVGRIESLAADRVGLRITATNLICDGPENAIPDHARAVFDLRADSAQLLEMALAEAARAGEFPGVEVEVSAKPGFPAMKRDEQLVALALAELERAGAAPLEERAAGASDASWTSWLGVPSVDGLGPVGGDDHTPAEWIDLDSVGPRVQALTSICSRMSAWLREPARID